MTTALYEDFIDRPDKEVVVLVEVEPRELLKGWAPYSGAGSGAYFINFDNVVQEDIVSGGIYREPVSVSQSRLQLKKMFHPGHVLSYPGSWCYNDGDDVTNLLTKTEELDDSSVWTTSGATLAANRVYVRDSLPPQAATLTEDSSSGSHYHRASISGVQAGVTVTVSVWAKQDSGDRGLRIGVYDAQNGPVNALALFDIGSSPSRGTLTDNGGYTAITSSIAQDNLDDSNEFLRCSFTMRSASGLTPSLLYFYMTEGPNNANLSYAGDGSSAIAIAYPQYEESDSLGVYVSTTNSSVTAQGKSLFASLIQTAEGDSPSEAAYDNTVLDDNPVAYWKLSDDPGGILEDSSGNGYDGTYVGEVFRGAEGLVHPVEDTAIQLKNKLDDRANRGEVTGVAGLSTAFTLEAWVRHDTDDSGIFLSKGLPYMRRNVCAWQDSGLNTRSLNIPSDAQPRTGEKVHMVFRHTGTTASIHINGVKVVEDASFDTLVPPSGTWNIGSHTNTSTNSFVDGKIDQVAIYDTALSDERIKAHYKRASGLSRFIDTAISNGVKFSNEVDYPLFADFRVHLANIPKIFNDIYYEPRLTPDSLPDVHQELPDLLFGQVNIVGEGEVHITNADALFDKLADEWSWKNAQVGIFIGGDELNHYPENEGTVSGDPVITSFPHTDPAQDYVKLGSYVVEDFATSPEDVTLFIRDVHQVGLGQVPVNVFNTLDYPNMDEDFEGKPIPVLFGMVKDITPVLIDDNNQRGTYLIADPAIEGLWEIEDVYLDGTSQSISGFPDVDLSPSGCTFTVLTSAATPLTVTCDAKGPIPLGKDWETSKDYLKHYGELTGFIFNSILGVPENKIDAGSAKRADVFDRTKQVVTGLPGIPEVNTQTENRQGVYVDSVTTARAVIRKLEVGVLGRTIINSEGVVTPTIFTPAYTTSSIHIGLEDIASIQVDPKIETTFDSIVAKGSISPTTNKAEEVYTVINTSCDCFGAFKTSKGNTLTINTAFNYADKAVDEDFIGSVQDDLKRFATRVSLMQENTSLEATIQESGMRLMNSDVGDTIRVSFPRVPSKYGVWESFPMDILAITKKLSPFPTVEVRVGNFRGLSGIVGQWSASTTSDWSNASVEEKTSSGFWTDENGLVDSNDPDSDVSRWG